MSEPLELDALLEAILFVTPEPVRLERLWQVFPAADREAAEAALERLRRRYGGDGRGVMLEEVAGGIRLATPPDLNAHLRRFFEVTGQNRLSMAALETLAIISYRQPISGPEIQTLRGVHSAGVLKTLLDRRLIRIVGRKQVVGKPFLYGTTREFLMHFGLRELSELPPLEEFEETFGPALEELDYPRPVESPAAPEEAAEEDGA